VLSGAITLAAALTFSLIPAPGLAVPDDGPVRPPATPAQLAIIKHSPLARGKTPPGPEPAEPYVPQTTCVPFEQPGVAAFRTILYRMYSRTSAERNAYNIRRVCSAGGLSEHLEGRAFDFKADIDVGWQRRQAEALISWLTADEGAQAKRFGIMYIIWDQHVWNQQLQVWHHMEDRGSKTDNHRDHVHFSFTWNGALKRTSYWTGRTPATDYGPCRPYRNLLGAHLSLDRHRTPNLEPCPEPAPMPQGLRRYRPILEGQSSARVSALQRFLSRVGISHAGATGYYSSTTYLAVRRFQKSRDLPPSGIWDRITQQATERTFR
jgi:Putative peptidoglycan binding domain